MLLSLIALCNQPVALYDHPISPVQQRVVRYYLAEADIPCPELRLSRWDRGRALALLEARGVRPEPYPGPGIERELLLRRELDRWETDRRLLDLMPGIGIVAVATAASETEARGAVAATRRALAPLQPERVLVLFRAEDDHGPIVHCKRCYCHGLTRVLGDGMQDYAMALAVRNARRLRQVLVAALGRPCAVRLELELEPPRRNRAVRRMTCRVWLRTAPAPKVVSLIEGTLGLDRSRGDRLSLETGPSARKSELPGTESEERAADLQSPGVAAPPG